MEPIGREKYLTDDELRAFLAATRDRKRKTALRDRALFLVLATVGPRPAEACALTTADVVFGAEPRLRLRRLKKRSAQGYLDDVPIGQKVARVLRAWLRERGDAEGPLFPSQRGGRMSVRAVERLFKLYARRAGLAPRFAVYCLRHTAGRRIYETSGGDLRMVQATLGHASTRTSEIYAHVTPERRRRAAESVLADL